METHLLEKFKKLFSISQSSTWFRKCFESPALPLETFEKVRIFTCVVYGHHCPHSEITNICPVTSSSVMKKKDRSTAGERASIVMLCFFIYLNLLLKGPQMLLQRQSTP